ncbi:MAG TPA: phage tail sheath subtilisin-like domain-containing protein [Roseomonas sp.]|jgi:phage tail sheath gpL-like
MSGAISFDQIPASIRVPGSYIEISNTRALRGLTTWPARVLLLGQRLAAGTAAPLVPQRIVDADQARRAFGRGSALAQAFEAWFRANPPTEIWGLGLADPEGAAATTTLTLTGPATAAGAIALLIGGRRVEVAVSAGQAATAVATALQAAVMAEPDLAVTADAAGAVVTLTARHKGEIGNAIPVRHSFHAGEALPAGIGLAIAAGTPGTLNPDIADALDAVAEMWFTDIVHPWTDATNLAALEAKLAVNAGPSVMRDGHGWTALDGTHAALTAAGAARNSQFSTILGIRGAVNPPWEWAATLAAACIPALAIDPARPVQTLALPGLVAPAIADRFVAAERELLLRNGISTVTVNDAGQVFVERVITTYQTSASGAADASFLDVETMKTLAFLRYDLRSLIALRFPRFKLADDGTDFARGQAVVTPGTIRAEIVARFKQWEANGLVEGVDQFKAELIVQRSASDPNRVDALLPPDLVNQFRVFAAQIQFIL